MNHKHVIRPLALGIGDEIAITNDEFDAIKNALLGLNQALGLEEKFDIVMEDYFTLEQELLQGATRHFCFPAYDWDTMTSLRANLNRRLLHFLNSARMYRDQSKSSSYHIFGRRSQEAKDIEEYKKKESNDVLGYKVLEQLRNYAQHNNLPIDGLQYNHSQLIGISLLTP